MRIVLISDTHENDVYVAKAVEHIKTLQPDLVLHLGDIISPPTLEQYEGLPMRFIFGNNDGEREGLIEKCEQRGWVISDTYETNEFFAAHGHKNDWQQAVNTQKYKYVFHGHKHVKKDERVGNTRIINPGALFRNGWKITNDYSYCLLDTKTDQIEWFTIKNEMQKPSE